MWNNITPFYFVNPHHINPAVTVTSQLSGPLSLPAEVYTPKGPDSMLTVPGFCIQWLSFRFGSLCVREYGLLLSCVAICQPGFGGGEKCVWAFVDDRQTDMDR